MVSEQLVELHQLPTLRKRLLWQVLAPLALTWLLGTVGMLAVANLFVQRAFDRSLLDDARLLVANVKFVGDELKLDLSSRELSHVLFDATESVYFAVLKPDGSLIAGHAGLRQSATPDANGVAYGDISYKGKNLRSVRVAHTEDPAFAVVLAQTRQARDALLRQLLLLAIAPQVLLLVILAAWLRRAIGRSLRPLANLEHALAQRPAHDLHPLVASADDAGAAATRDVEQLRQALNELLARIATSVQAQREFAGNVAHELRTPLAGIRALAAYGLTQPDPAVWRAQLQAVLGSEARATHLVDQLLALALADESGPGLRLQPVDLAEQVRQAVLRWLPRADALGVDLGADLPNTASASAVWVQAHPMLVEGILNNLIDNALRYGSPALREGEGQGEGDGASAADAHPPLAGAAAQPTGAALTPTITVALTLDATMASPTGGQATGAAVTLSVIDNGPGIAPEQAEQWMARWQRGGTASSHHVRGSGLGLAIVGEYARRLGARFELEVAEGGGLKAQLRWEPGSGS